MWGTGVAEGHGAGNMGAMHDGAKRRLTADTPATSSDWEKLEPTYVGEVIVENDTDEALVAALDASTVGAGGDVHLGPVDLPQGIDSLEMWGKTMMSFGQYKGTTLKWQRTRAYGIIASGSDLTSTRGQAKVQHWILPAI